MYKKHSEHAQRFASEQQELLLGKWLSFLVLDLHGAPISISKSQNVPFGTVDRCSVSKHMGDVQHAIFIISQHLVAFLLHQPPNTECRV